MLTSDELVVSQFPEAQADPVGMPVQLSQRMRALLPTVNPHHSDQLDSVSDDEHVPVHARVVRRQANRLWVQLRVNSSAGAVAS